MRMIAASMVVIGHAYVLSPQDGKQDLLRRFFGIEYSGSFAVKVFFFISGLVVTNSLMTKKDPLGFVFARFFRIFPALLFVLLLTTAVMGPLVTTHSIQDYFKDPSTFAYFWDNIKLNTVYALPGVFSSNPYPIAVNGSLWTLPYEVGAYLVLLGMFLTGVAQRPAVGTIAGVLIIIDSLLPTPILLPMGTNPDVNLLPTCFAFGAILALNKDKVRLHHGNYLGLALLAWFFWGTKYAHCLLIMTACIGTLVLSGSSWVKRLKFKYDISYGIYLWGFPIQQCVSRFYPHNVYANQILTLSLSILMGYISWQLVEKRAIDAGAWLVSRIKFREMPLSTIGRETLEDTAQQLVGK